MTSSRYWNVTPQFASLNCQMFESVQYERSAFAFLLNADGQLMEVCMKKIEMSVALNAQLESGNIRQISPKTFF